MSYRPTVFEKYSIQPVYIIMSTSTTTIFTATSWTNTVWHEIYQSDEWMEVTRRLLCSARLLCQIQLSIRAPGLGLPHQFGFT